MKVNRKRRTCKMKQESNTRTAILLSKYNKKIIWKRESVKREQLIATRWKCRKKHNERESYKSYWKLEMVNFEVQLKRKPWRKKLMKRWKLTGIRWKWKVLRVWLATNTRTTIIILKHNNRKKEKISGQMKVLTESGMKMNSENKNWMKMKTKNGNNEYENWMKMRNE